MMASFCRLESFVFGMRGCPSYLARRPRDPAVPTAGSAFWRDRGGDIAPPSQPRAHARSDRPGSEVAASGIAERPYADPRVTAHPADAQPYLAHAGAKRSPNGILVVSLAETLRPRAKSEATASFMSPI